MTLCVGAANAGVTINGKGLGNIDDIVLETTGSRTVARESVLKVYKNSDNNGHFGIIAVKGDSWQPGSDQDTGSGR